jgi:hypothetical protein
MWPTRRFAVLILLHLFGIFLTSSGRVVAATDNEKMIIVRTLVAGVASETARTERYKLGEELMEFVHHMDKSDRDVFDPDVVDKVASLLSDDDEVIRSFAASTLGQMGPSALRSVGALLKALREAGSDSRRIYRATSFNAKDAIIGALSRLGVCVFRIETYNREVCDYLLR